MVRLESALDVVEAHHNKPMTMLFNTHTHGIHGIISILNAKILRAEPGRRAEGATRGSRKAQRDRRYEEGTAAARVGAEARLMKKAGYFEVQRGTSLSLSLSLAC